MEIVALQTGFFSQILYSQIHGRLSFLSWRGGASPTQNNGVTHIFEFPIPYTLY